MRTSPDDGRPVEHWSRAFEAFANENLAIASGGPGPVNAYKLGRCLSTWRHGRVPLRASWASGLVFCAQASKEEHTQ